MTVTETPTTTLNIEVDYADQVRFFNPEANTHTVTVIGCGGIGGNLLPVLATMGFDDFIIWDADEVEHRNMASTVTYEPGHLFRSKVEVMAERLQALGVSNVDARNEFFDSSNPDHIESLSGIVISAVDSMSIRQMIWEAIQFHPDVAMFMDGRIGGEQWELIMLEPFDVDRMDWYEKFQLFDEDQALDEECGARGVNYPSVALAGYIASNLARFWRGETVPRKLTCHMTSNKITMTN